jgi:predicted nucleic acid-binding protein
MTDNPFLDTDILVYAFDRADTAKQERAIEVLEGRVYKGRPVISTQVIQEFYVTVVRKLSNPLPEDKALEACRRLSQFPVVQIDTEMIRTQ